MEFLKILLGAADREEGYRRPWLALLNIAAVIAGQNTIITLQTEGEEGRRREARSKTKPSWNKSLSGNGIDEGEAQEGRVHKKNDSLKKAQNNIVHNITS